MVHDFCLDVRWFTTLFVPALHFRSAHCRIKRFLQLLAHSTGVHGVWWLVRLHHFVQIVFVLDSFLFLLFFVVFTHPHKFLFFRLRLNSLLALFVINGRVKMNRLVLRGCIYSFGLAWIFGILPGLRFFGCQSSGHFQVIQSHLVSFFMGRFILVIFFRLWLIGIIIWVLLRLRFFFGLLFGFWLFFFILIVLVRVFLLLLVFFKSGSSLVHKFNSVLNLFFLGVINAGFVLLFDHSAVF